MTHAFFLLAMIACAPGGIKLPEPPDTGNDTGGPVPEMAWVSTPYTANVSNELYYIAHVEGSTYAVSNPTYDGFVGSIYLVDASLPTDELETTSQTFWTGEAAMDVLGVQVGVLSDGTNLYLGSQTYGTDSGGRFLAVPIGSGSGNFVDYATLDVMGTTPDGYLGTGMATNAGRLLISATTSPKLYVDSVSRLGSGAQIQDVDLSGAPIPEDTSRKAGDGFLAMDIVPGDEGNLVVSFGGLLQHVTLDGVPDWWRSLVGGDSGTGAIPDAEYGVRDTNLVCNGKRMREGYFVGCMPSSYDEATGYIVEPMTGDLLDTLPGVIDVAQGEFLGRGWTAYSYLDYLGSNQLGFLRVVDTDGFLLLEEAYPYEPPYACPGMIDTDGVLGIGVVCHGYSYAAFGSMSL